MSFPGTDKRPEIESLNKISRFECNSAQTTTSVSPNAAATVVVAEPTSASAGSSKAVTIGATLAAVFGFIILIGLGIYVGTRKRKTEEVWRKSMVLPARGEKGMSVMMTTGGGVRPDSIMSAKMRPGSSSGSGVNSPASSIGPSAKRYNTNPSLATPNGTGHQQRMPNPSSPLSPRQPLLPAASSSQPSTPSPQPETQLPPSSPSSPTSLSQSQSQQPLLYQDGSQQHPTPSIRIVHEEPEPPTKEDSSDGQHKYPRESASLEIQELPYEVSAFMTYPPTPGQPEKELHPMVA